MPQYEKKDSKFTGRPFPSELCDDIKTAIEEEIKIRKAIDPPNVKRIFTLAQDGVKEGVLVGSYDYPTSVLPRQSEIHELIKHGLDCSQSGDVEGAIQSFRKARSIDPKFRTATFQLAYHLSRKKKFDESLSLYIELLRQDFLDEHVWCNIGGIVLTIGFKNMAQFLFEIALMLDPEDKIAQDALKLVKVK